jgi:gas vesicle protein
LEKLMFEEATRALVTTVRESTQARWQELEEKLKQEMECEIAVQQQAFLKEKTKEMVKQMQEVVQTEVSKFKSRTKLLSLVLFCGNNTIKFCNTMNNQTAIYLL